MKQGIFTKEFWLATGERAINTFLQAFAAAFVVGGMPTTFAEIPLWSIVQVALIATGLSVIKSVIINTATGDGPGFGKVETLREPARG